MEDCVLPRMHEYGIYLYMQYVHNPESTRKVLQTGLTNGNDMSWKIRQGGCLII